MILRIFSILIILLLFSTTALAGTTGKIAGQVVDKNTGDPLPGANIYLENYPYGAATDGDGFYFVLNVPPGTYTVVAEVLSFGKVRYENVKVNVDLTTRLNYELNSEALEGDEVTVIAQRPLIQKDVTSTSKTVSIDEMEAMPVESFNDVIQLEAGVVAGHFRGGRSGEVAYLVDGIPVNDPFNNSVGVSVENSSIQQLEIISGTFNAEYGQAMSGVVNIITRDGSHKFEADLSGYGGSFLTNHDDIFPNIGDFKNGRSLNLQGSLSGPVPFMKKLTFFATGRVFEDDGHLYGKRLYNTTDTSAFTPTGDGEWVAMNDFVRKSFNGKLSYFLSSAFKLSYAYHFEDEERSYYDHGFSRVPDAIQNHYRNSYHHNVILNHTLSNNIYQTFKFSRSTGQYQGYLYEDPNDPRYVIPERGLPSSGYTFRSGGNDNSRYDRETVSDVAKWDLAGQFSHQHKVGLGVELKRHDLRNFWTAFRGDLDQLGNETIIYPEKFAPGMDEYDVQPMEFAAYIQDKMEYEDLIINAGVRFEYFDPKTKILSDPKNPEFNPLFPYGNIDAGTKMQVSPRLGVAYPISTSGVIHVSYGHFFQIPSFELLYQGIKNLPDGTTQYKVDRNGLNSLVGNPDLEPQRTVSYEFGLQQVLYSNIVMDFTAYYRDIRNLVDTEVIATYDQLQYGRYINRDYANVRGIIISLEKRFSNHWGASMDYTFQYADGNASDPRSVFQDNQADPPREPEKKLLPLDWDQRSTLNVSVNVGTPGSWNLGLIGRFGTSTPYTSDPTFTYFKVSFLNDRVKPTFYTFDLLAEKHLKIAGVGLNAFMLVYNLFDRKNELSVYGSTGRADQDLNTKFAGEIIGLNTVDQYINNPGFYSAPRQVRIGFGIQL